MESTTAHVEVERRIQARPEIVFSYLVDAEKFRLWQGVGAELDPRPGGVFRVIQTGRSRLVARGEYVEVEPPRRLVFTWGWEQRDGFPAGSQAVPPGSSTVEITLTPDGEATIVRVRHSGLPSEDSRAFHGWGWRSSLERLAILLEGGDPGPNPAVEA
jgi:uncharacterized protein YndB with AHSA1/START domain